MSNRIAAALGFQTQGRGTSCYPQPAHGGAQRWTGAWIRAALTLGTADGRSKRRTTARILIAGGASEEFEVENADVTAVLAWARNLARRTDRTFILYVVVITDSGLGLIRLSPTGIPTPVVRRRPTWHRCWTRTRTTTTTTNTTNTTAGVAVAQTTLSVTGTLPLVARLYGQTWCVASMSARAVSSSSAGR